MNLKEANEVFRRAIIKAYFEPQLLKMDYHKSSVKHPNIPDDGLTLEDILHLYFDVLTGNDYPDGDEWLSIEYFAYSVKLPDGPQGPDYSPNVGPEASTTVATRACDVQVRKSKNCRVASFIRQKDQGLDVYTPRRASNQLNDDHFASITFLKNSCGVVFARAVLHRKLAPSNDTRLLAPGGTL